MDLRIRTRFRSILLLATVGLVFSAAFGVSTILGPNTATAAQTIPYKINFQGRLTDNSGNILSDGLYNIKFRLFDAASGGTNVWEGDRVRGASDFRVQVTNGLFNIQFGDTTLGDPALSPSLFAGTFPLYLEVELPTPATANCATNGCAVFTEGAMTPRQPLASSAYAFNSDTLDGLDSAAFGQLSAVQSWTDTNTFSKSGGAAIVLSGTAASSGSILQIGSALSGGNANGTLFGANSTATGDLINLQVSSALRLKVDNNGAITSAGNYSFTSGANRTLTVAQAASGAGNDLTIAAGQSNTGAVNGGNLILQAGATGGSGTTGSVIVKANGTESASAFQVQQATGAPVFTIDTSANKVVVGDATGVNTATTLLVIDTATADPSTGYNGAQYYNSTTNTFRCYQAGAWTTCGGTNITATSNSTASFVSGLANVAGTATGVAVETLVFTSATAVSNTAGATGFTAPSSGSFRTCLTKNNAAITAGTVSVRWRVNGVSVGAAACTMNSTANRQSATSLDSGVVTFSAGNTIGIAYDSSGLLPAATNDFTTYWSVEYNSSTGNGLTLQFVYDSSSSPASITLSDNKSLVVNAADTATDPNILYNLLCTTSCGANGRFAVQNSGTDVFSVAANSGGISLAGDTTVAANKSLTFTSGSGAITQNYTSATAANAQNINVTNSNTGAGVTVQGIDLTPTNSSTPSSSVNTLNVIDFSAGTLSGTNVTNGINFESATGFTNFINAPTTKLNSSGDLISGFTALNGTSTANGAGTNATSLILASATNFDIGNYVQVNSANCGGTGVNPCYAKITNKVTNTLTITPALTWANGSTVNEYHIPEIGGTDLAQALGNRYGRGYFIAGVAAGNGTTFYNEDSIETNLTSFDLLTNNVATLNIGTAATTITLGNSGTTVTVQGDLATSGTATVTAAGGLVIGSGNAVTVGAATGVTTTCTGGQVLQNQTTAGGVVTGGTCATVSGSGANATLSNLSSPTSINQNLLPDTTNTRDLGSSVSTWANGYFGTSLVTPALNATASGGTITTNAGTIQRTAVGTTTIDLVDTANTTLAVINSGTGLANVTIDGGLSIGSGQTYKVNGTQISSADLSNDANITKQGNTFNGNSQLVQTTAGGALPAISGANLTSLTSGNLSGALPAISGASLTSLSSSALTGALPAISGASLTSLSSSALTGALPAISGASLTSLTASALTGALPAISGASLTSLNASSLAQGTGAVSLTSAAATALTVTANAASTWSTSSGNLTIDSGGGTLLLGAATTSIQKAAAALSIDLATAATSTLTIKNSNGVNLANLVVTGGVSIGAGQTYKINGTQISSADLSNDANITKQGNTFNGNSQLVQTTAGGALPAISGANLTSLTSGNLTGALPAISGASLTSLTSANLTGALPAISGASLTSLNPTNLATGSGAVTIASTTSPLTLTSGSGTIVVGSNTIQRAAAGLTLDVNNAASSTLTVTNSNASFVANLSVEGGVVIGSGQTFTVGATSGVGVSCTGGQFLQNQVTVGGITTGGTCAAAGGGSTDLQTAYTNSTAPATINLNTSAKDFVINATDQATDPNVLFNLQCATCSAGGGRFAVQDNGTDILTINPIGSVVVAPVAGQNLSINLAPASQVNISSTTAPTVDQVVIDNTASAGVTTAGTNGLSVNYKGGAAAVEAAGMRIDYAPGATSGGTWSGLRIVANSTGAASGVNAYGIKLEGPSSAGAGNDEGLYVGTGWDIGIDVQSGGLQLAAQTDPATPTAGNLRIYAKDIAGKIMPKYVGPSGVDTPFQPNLGFNRVSWCTPAGGATLTTFISCIGSTFTNTGTAANPTPTTTNLFTSTRRATFSTGTTAGTVASNRQSTLQVWRGNAAGLGGFFYTIRFGTSALQTGNRAFVGLADVVTAPTNVDPTTNTTPGRVGMAINANTGNWKLINNVTGTAPTVLDLGANFPVNTTNLYELILFSAPNGSSIGYRVQNLSTGVQSSGSLTTNIPASTTFLAPMHWITNNATAAAAILDFGGWYLESDN